MSNIANSRNARETKGRQVKSAQAFDALKRDIMLGDLPAGEMLTELELAERFGCSQGTVREALLQLQEEGLVWRNGHRGTQVSDCTEAEAVEMFRVRQQIEGSGIVRVMRHPSRTLVVDLNEMIDGMVDAATAEDELRLAAFDRDFHRRLFRDAALPALDPILQRCLIHNHRFKISRTTTPRNLMATALRHRPLVAAIQQGDAPGAIAALHHHIATIVDFGPNVFADSTQ